VLRALNAFYQRGESGLIVEDIAARFQIAVSTIYQWKKKFESDAPMLLEVLQSLSGAMFMIRIILLAVNGLFAASLDKYRRTFGFSFMQGSRRHFRDRFTSANNQPYSSIDPST
jgi:hypothetical protein